MTHTQAEAGTSLPIIIAHRGYSARAPENTLAAVRAAVEVGAGGIEWDISTAACGTPVLFHDTSLGRTTNGVGPLRRRTLAQLQALDAGSWFDESFAGEGIPTLQDACRLLGELSFDGKLVAEIKGWREMEDVDRMVRIIRDEGLERHTLFIAIDWTTLDRVLRVYPEADIAFIVEREERFQDGLERAGSAAGAGLAVDYRFLLDTPARIRAAEERGIPLGVWTVNDSAAADRLYREGIRDFTSNEVEALLEWRSSLASG